MAVLTNEGDFDPRNHKSFLIEGYELESLADIDEEKVGLLNSLMLEAQELEFDEQRVFCQRYIALRGGVKAARAKLAADVAKRDEALRMAEAENRVQDRRADNEAAV